MRTTRLLNFKNVDVIFVVKLLRCILVVLTPPDMALFLEYIIYFVSVQRDAITPKAILITLMLKNSADR